MPAPARADRRPACYAPERFPRLVARWEVIRDECLGPNAPTLDVDRVGESHVQVDAETVERARRTTA